MTMFQDCDKQLGGITYITNRLTFEGMYWENSSLVIIEVIFDEVVGQWRTSEM